MAHRYDTMMEPRVEELLARTGSKFSLVTLASQRAREINTYFSQLGSSLGTLIPPQVTSTARKPLSIAFDEISQDKIVGVPKAETVGDEETVAALEVVEDGDDA